jgi:hypothetical protein
MNLGEYVIAQWGLWGVVTVALVWELRKTRTQLETLQAQFVKELKDEHALRLTDAKENTRAMLELYKAADAMVDKLSTIATTLQKP